MCAGLHGALPNYHKLIVLKTERGAARGEASQKPLRLQRFCLKLLAVHFWRGRSSWVHEQELASLAPREGFGMAVEEAGAEASNRDPQAGTEGDAGEDAAMHVEEATGGGETGEALWSQFHGHVPGRFVPYSAAAGAFRGGKLENNFLKTCRWSPDGLCVFASTEDNQIRVFELPQGEIPS